MGKPLQLSGQKFGKLTAIEKTNKRTSQGNVIWLCKCECGNIIEVAGSSLKSGNTKSCGCNNKIKKLNKINSEKAKIKNGTKFGKLTVIEDLGFREQIQGHNRRWYKCQCECGEIIEVMGNRLKTGNKSSCGKCNFSSKGEYYISKILSENNYIFEKDVVFQELFKQTQRRLRFDFIIYNKDKTIKCFIEFDGRQHKDGPDKGFWSRKLETLETIQERDKIKNDFCLKNNYLLYRIPYYYVNNLSINNIFDDKFLVKE